MVRIFAALALAAVSAAATAQQYPTRSVRIVVPFAVGGSADVYGRFLAAKLSDSMGQPFVIENRPGAATNLATEAVINAPPDGYTLLLANSASAINASLYEKLSFNFIRDTTPVAGISTAPTLCRKPSAWSLPPASSKR